MNTFFDRRTFVRLGSALGAFLAGQASSQTRSQSRSRPGRGGPIPVNHRKNFVGIQVKPFCWIDEGIDEALDNIQKKGNVNSVFAYTYDFEGARITKDGSIPKPDHGIYGDGKPDLIGGAFYDYDQKYFVNTKLKEFRSPDYGNFNVITALAPKLKARGMEFFCWDYNNSSAKMVRGTSGFHAVTEVDCYGKRMISACFNHPDYRAHLVGRVESQLRGYPSEIAGFMWGCERMGPFHNTLGGQWTNRGSCCFCEHCRAKARERDINVDRARRGYQAFSALVQAARQDKRPLDGYFVAFWRLLLEYPEILAWERLWMDSYQETRSDLYTTAKASAPEKPFGFHIQQNMTFSPFYRASEEYSYTKNHTDFLKIACYNNAGGPRIASYLDNLHATIFHDATPKDFLPFFYKIMDYNEGPYDVIPQKGLTADYVARETKRTLVAVGDQVKVYPGIDIDVPTALDVKRTKPDDVRQAVRAAFGAGAHGVVLSREYPEMWLANLSAAGDTLREVFAKSGA